MIAPILRAASQLAFALSAAPLRAEEPAGCDKLKIEHCGAAGDADALTHLASRLRQNPP
jgi:hypothetical protein